MMRLRTLGLLVALAGCQVAESYKEPEGGLAPTYDVSVTVQHRAVRSTPGDVWALVSINGSAPRGQIMMKLHDDGAISGRGPCNLFVGRQAARAPRFEARDGRATDTSCGQIATENAFFTALRAVNRQETRGRMLILTGGGQRLEFRRGG